MSEAERAGASRQDKSGRLLAGRYRLGDVLGRGGMGTVWRAEDETLGRTVAVKELRFPTSIDEDEKRRLITRTLREAKAIARIRNNSAVTVFDVVDEDNRPWIVMELVEGKSLAEAIREDGLLEPKRAAEVGLAILDVLRAAHREGILHRDVKPSNVLIAEDGRVVLTDFGIAQVEGDPSITSTGMLVGAPSYISPERARGHKPGPAADLWSLGGLLYASVEGVPPYDKGSAIATLTAVMTEPLEEPKNAGPLRSVIYGLLAKDPEQRLDDAGARAMLNEVLHAPQPKEPEPVDATRVVALPPVPEEGTGKGSSGGSGAKRGEEAADRFRGALRSVRKAAGAATASAAARAKSGGTDVSGGTGAAGAGTSSAGSSASASAPAPGKPGAAAVGKPNPSSAGKPGSSAAATPAGTGSGVGQGTAVGGGGRESAVVGSNSGPVKPSSGWPVVPEPDRPPRSVPRAPLTDVVPRRTLVIVAVVVVLAVLGVVLALTLGGDDGSSKDNKGSSDTKAAASSGTSSGTTAGSSGTPKAGGSGSGSGGTHTDSGSKDNTGTGSDEQETDDSSSAGTASGSGGSDDSGSGSGDSSVKTYKSSQGFSIGLPKGWKYQSTGAAGARFTGPDGQKLLVGWTTTPKDDPVADWKNQEQYMVRSQYKRIRIEQVDYRGWNTADWEFTYTEGGTKYRSIDRGFVVNAHQGYALMYTAKASEWDSDLRKDTWQTLAKTFQPKS
ncbi:serine/threonine protein kinase [Streptomyces avermitilis]|uniref:non-specific serine/threonine protein kinase n=1 Tax=Streptomyces avermitilis (strain ATCC 31267 / DSM 46492 / JCM 5070 / NBRC 14893 / NCIMB 12804 / NRRL 8165 / MA-4680) TaxID=227882 RepID=Q81ZX1_STRAW|nr:MULTISPECIES: serine/threonine-protein kinase [Streptomyces]KUN52370.1 serine/threonine protein kinase [Streptomyces avermitilis]MYT00590.1 protein kinase [Streptomyces sp. SID5469]OOV30266.1 serine/threonine protein kinase [Streptomyces avermitilis]BAC72717.1 putative serine/threonine protein kinase [Streptomyces avermitilis MA-4680 = NBRC 14893]GDY83724.1 serine/threonine protein kinase [Streptomyces avermitilis]